MARKRKATSDVPLPTAKRVQKEPSKRATSSTCSRSIVPMNAAVSASKSRQTSKNAKGSTRSQTLGVQFLNSTQQKKFAVLKGRKIYNTKMADDVAMQEIGVLDGVKKLLSNIGWEGLIEWDDIGYKRTTLEFLSSVYLEDNIIHFRLFNKSLQLTTEEICIMIGAPTLETSDRDAYKKNPAYDADRFWKSITAKSMIKGSNAKSSQIVHPVLRVAHRIISCIIDSRLDSGSVTKHELYLLWCMINPQPSPPNFGQYLCHKLLQVADAEKGEIFCSSIITILGQHDSLHLHFPNGMETVPGPRYLDMDQMIKMKMFEESTRHPGQIWLLGTHHYKHFMVEKTKRAVLALADPVSTTKWLLKSNMEVDATSSSEDEASTQHQQDQHQEYMARFTSIDTQLHELQADMTHIQKDLRALRDHLMRPALLPPPSPQ